MYLRSPPLRPLTAYRKRKNGFITETLRNETDKGPRTTASAEKKVPAEKRGQLRERILRVNAIKAKLTRELRTWRRFAIHHGGGSWARPPVS